MAQWSFYYGKVVWQQPSERRKQVYEVTTAYTFVVYGIWGANGSIGNILGGVIASWLLQWRVSWDYTFYFTAGLSVCGSMP